MTAPPAIPPSNGIPLRIIDKEPEFHVGQRGSGIQPRTLELYGFLGVLPDILANGQPNKKRATYKMPEGKDIVHVQDMTPYVAPTPGVPYVSAM